MAEDGGDMEEDAKKSPEYSFISPSSSSIFLHLLVMLFPQIAKAVRILTSNKEGKVICKNDGLVLGGVQFGGLV